MTRRALSTILLLTPAGYASGKQSESVITDPSDRETWQWLLKRFGEKETVKRSKKKKIELVGMTNKGPYDVGIMIDKQGRVTRARFNHGNFTNEEWAKLAGFSHMVDLTCWHNFVKTPKAETRPDYTTDHPLSGSGLSAFKDHPLASLNIGGSTFNNHGLKALATLPNFKKIKAYHTRVDDEGIQVLAGNTTIRFLNLGPQFSMRITEAALEPIGKMKALTQLEFNETRVTWENGLKHLLPLKDQLKRVKLDKTWIDDTCLQKARRAFPKTTLEHSSPESKFIDAMKSRMEA